MTSRRISKRTVLLTLIIIIFGTFPFILGGCTNSRPTDSSGATEVSSEDTGDSSIITPATSSEDTGDSSIITPAASSEDTGDSNIVTPAVNSGDTQDSNIVTPEVNSEETDVSSDAEADISVTPAVNSDQTADSIIYTNEEYGFEITLPASWKGYTILQEDWQGTAFEGEHQGEVVETGKKLIIRHPKWTEETPRQDIPIMIFTPAQWELVEKEEIAVSAAPVGPSKLTSNSNYIFALPARYNYAYDTGYEEVEKIISDNFYQ